VTSRASRDEGLRRFGRALLVGGSANLLDIGLLAACLRWLLLPATSARLIALACSGALQFFANRSFAFRAQAGSLPRQAALSLGVEAASLLLNWWVFRSLVPLAGPLPLELLGFAISCTVFVSFTYPLRRSVVFKV